MQRQLYFGLMVAFMLIAGCTASTRDVMRLKRVRIQSTDDQLAGLSVDAKQRFVWTPRSKNGSSARSRYFICAEPSPDALSALSSSVAAKVSADVANEGSGSAEFQKSFAEAVQNIGKRTVTIQLLRDGLYRACEAYNNGVIDDFAYALILNKIDNVMVQLVALESLEQGGVGAANAEDQTKLQQAYADQQEEKRASGAVQIAQARYDAAKQEQRKRTNDRDTLNATLTAQKKNSADLQKNIDDMQKVVDADQKAQDKAKEEGKEPPAPKGDKDALQKLKLQKIELEQEVAVNEARLDVLNDQVKTASADTRTALTELNKASDDSKKATEKSAASQAVAKNVKETLQPGVAKAIVNITKEHFGSTTILGACLIWFSKHAKETTGGDAGSWPYIAQACKGVLERAGKQQAKAAGAPGGIQP